MENTKTILVKMTPSTKFIESNSLQQHELSVNDFKKNYYFVQKIQDIYGTGQFIIRESLRILRHGEKVTYITEFHLLDVKEKEANEKSNTL